MGAIYLRDGDDFVAMHEAKYDAEAVLQSLLAEHPEILAGGESTSGWVLVRREAGIPDAADASDRWALDHLFLDARGVPTLVEVKRSSDTRARREVVAQMLEYAANATAFWRVELLRSWFEDEVTRAGSAAAEMLLAIGVEDEDTFWSTVQTNLAADRIRLVFVADEIAAELRTIIEFLNRRMTETEVFAIEVKQYIEADGSRQTIVPRVLGQTEAARATKGASRRTASIPFDPTSAPEGFHELTALMDELAAALNLQVKDGPTGRNYRPAVSVRGARDQSGIAVLGSRFEFMLNLQIFRDLGADQLADDLLDRLRAFAGRPLTARSWPSLPCAVVVKEWERARRDVVEPYFAARAQLAASTPDS